MGNKMIKRKNFFPKVYTDKETEKLTEEYDVKSCLDYPVPSSVGGYILGRGEQKLLSISKCFGEFVGISLEDIDKQDYHSDFCEIYRLTKPNIRTERKGKLEILFPTEDLLINQRVKKNKHDR